MESQDVFSLLDELIPGLPNDVTLSHISTKLSWKTSYGLSAVSASWKKAVRSGLVHDTRVRSQSTETLVVLSHPGKEGRGRDYNWLYSTIDKTFCDLPPIPGFVAGHAWWWQIIALDGKIYALGGHWDRSSSNAALATSLYMMDLRTGPWQWKKLANMLEGRLFSSFGVIGGKIYVFGGLNYERGTLLSSSEMYDPKYNTWSPRKAMLHGGFLNQVLPIGDKLMLVVETRPMACSWHMYHPATDAWRVVKQPADKENAWGTKFTFEGNLYSMTVGGSHLLVYDIDTNSWRQERSVSWVGLQGENENFDVQTEVYAKLIVHANNELVAAVHWRNRSGRNSSSIIQSKGFSSEKKEMVWEKVQNSGCSCYWPSRFEPFLNTIEL